MATELDCDPWAALARTRLAALHVDGSHPSREILRAELLQIRACLDPFLDLLNDTSHTVPLLALPNELIADILLHLRDSHARKDKTPWFFVTHVCRRIRNIALGTAALWTEVSDQYGRRILLDFLRRSKDLPLRMDLRYKTILYRDRDGMERVAYLRLTGTLDVTRQLLFQHLPALETLHFNTPSYFGHVLQGNPWPDRSELLIPPNLQSLHMDGTPFPWSCPIYDNLSSLTLTDIHHSQYFNLDAARDLFARMRRIETIVLADVDINTTNYRPNERIELPPTLRSLQMTYRKVKTQTFPLMPLHGFRPGLHVSVELSSDIIRTYDAYLSVMLSRQVFDTVRPHPCKLRVDLSMDSAKMWYITLAYSYGSDNGIFSSSLFKIRFPLGSELSPDELGHLVKLQGEHITTLDFYLVHYLDHSRKPPEIFYSWSKLLVALSSTHTMSSTPCSFQLVCFAADEYQLADLRTLHLGADPLDDPSVAMKRLAHISRWLRRREDIGLAKVNVHVDEKLMEVLGGVTVEELAH
ncbi:hypothetical protein PENSPDRAFT_749995 [Peniophora sp. CONT]|nr:hypothetical protein PENSPDRAFT_749995 [Peniophora sp. CONT]